MMAFWKRVLLLLSLSWMVSNVNAQVMTHLYEAIVPVSSGQSSAALTVEAWQQVLTKLTGREIADLPGALVKPSERTLNDLVDRFEYKATSDARAFHVLFSAPLVNKELHSKRVPLWSPDRPLSLWWIMTVADGGAVTLLSMESPEAQSVLALAKQHAYPMVLPLGDLSDQEPLVGMSAALSPASLQALALRYRVNRVVVVRLKSGQASEWMWWSDQSEPKRWQQPDNSELLTVLTAGLSRSVGFELATDRSAIKTGAPVKRELIVLGANSFMASEALAKELDAQHEVFRWKHEALSHDGLRLALVSTYSRLGVRRALSHISQLSPLLHDVKEQTSNENSPLVYVWGPVSNQQRAMWIRQYQDKTSRVEKHLIGAANNNDTSSARDSDDDESGLAKPFAYHAEAAYSIPSSDQAIKVMSGQPLLSKVDSPSKQEISGSEVSYDSKSEGDGSSEQEVSVNDSGVEGSE